MIRLVKDNENVKLSTPTILVGSGGGEGGEDGGYYTPTVAADGTLSWKASKRDMPEVAAVNIKGDKGEQGLPGKDGEKGEPGADGYSPVRGTDYWTAADIAEIKSYVDDAILGGSW